MELHDADIIIGEFMGYKYIKDEEECFDIWEHETKPSFTKQVEGVWSNNLDMLVPVWDKLKPICDFKFDICRALEDDRWEFELRSLTGSILFNHRAPTLQQAAAIATAKAIQGLKS